MILAYIDPGAGSLLIQAIIAAALSVPFLLRKSLRSAVGRLRRTDRPLGDKATRPHAEE